MNGRKLLPISAALSAFVFLIVTVLACLSFFLPFGVNQVRTIFSGKTLRFDAAHQAFVDQGVFFWHSLVSTYPSRGSDAAAALDSTVRSTGFIQIPLVARTHAGFSWLNDHTPTRFQLSNSERQISFPLWPLVVFSAILPVRWLMLHRLQRRNRMKGRCQRCGYDLRASKERCPECGEEIRNADHTESVRT